MWKQVVTSRVRRLFVIAALAVAGAASGPVSGLAQTGTIVGSVYDSIGGRPLADAAVFLWDTPYRGVSDEEGRFRIPDVPPGEYSLLFFHTQLGEMGISPGPVPITLHPGEEQEVRLATPSTGTVISTQCLMEDRPEEAGAVAGRVLDGRSGLALGGASVTLSWHDDLTAAPRTVVTRTDPDGWYRSCDVASDRPVLVAGTFFGRESPRREISVDRDGYTEARLDLFELRPSHVSGRLLDRETGEPVEGAVTWLRGTAHRVLTDDRGNFELDDVQPGTYMLMTDHVAYGTKMDTLNVPDGQRLSVEMMVDTRPIPIAPLTVEVERALSTPDHRAGGIMVTRSQIDRVRQTSRDASDILRSLHIPGVIVQHQTAGRICVGYISGQVKMNQTGCVEMIIYINNVRATDPFIALRLPPDAIDRMVIYKPVEAGNLFGLGAGNGVWMIFTNGN